MVPREVGWLATPNVEGLSDALRQSRVDPGAATMGAQARDLYMTRYTPEAVLAELLSLYRDVLAEPQNMSPLGARSG
jgi:glycosyltransferase involved in cell wall biosynthesis